jgi:hypothetical protein
MEEEKKRKMAEGSQRGTPQRKVTGRRGKGEQKTTGSIKGRGGTEEGRSRPIPQRLQRSPQSGQSNLLVVLPGVQDPDSDYILPKSTQQG